MKAKTWIIMGTMLIAAVFAGIAGGQAESTTTQNGKFDGGPAPRVVRYADIHDALLAMRAGIDQALAAGAVRAASAITVSETASIAEWFDVPEDLKRSEQFDEWDGLTVREESATLLIKRRAGYLRIIDKASVERDRTAALAQPDTLALSESHAQDAAMGFADYLGVDRAQIGRVDVKKVVGESGGPDGVVINRVESEFLVTFDRVHNGVRVAGAMFRVAVDDDGKIKRALVRWPELEPVPSTRKPVALEKVAETIKSRLDEMYERTPAVRYDLAAFIHQKYSDGRFVAEPVIRVMSAGVTDETSSPIVFFNVPLTN